MLRQTTEPQRIKILVLGPKQTGKSNIVNVLSGHKDSPSSEYKPTVALRILEAERTLLSEDKRNATRVTVELWDVSGSKTYQSCWPAVEKNADGIIFVFNPFISNQDKELESWYKAFAEGKSREANCVIFAHRSTGQQSSQAKRYKISKSMGKMNVVETSLGTHTEDMFNAFDWLIENILKSNRNLTQDLRSSLSLS